MLKHVLFSCVLYDRWFAVLREVMLMVSRTRLKCLLNKTYCTHKERPFLFAFTFWKKSHIYIQKYFIFVSLEQWTCYNIRTHAEGKYIDLRLLEISKLMIPEHEQTGGYTR